MKGKRSKRQLKNLFTGAKSHQFNWIKHNFLPVVIMSVRRQCTPKKLLSGLRIFAI